LGKHCDPGTSDTLVTNLVSLYGEPEHTTRIERLQGPTS
jgi:hypothetical protein